jgi:LDH2 family malate/lactate/ureidoglycolate dehydrogenase
MHYRYDDLIHYAQSLLTAAGLEPAKAAAVAEILVEGDLMGHNTHGLALLPGYLGELESGSMEKLGAPTVLADHPAALTWDGRRLPGPWLVLEAMALAAERAAIQGTCTVVIRRSHHIACLAAYLKRATDKGLVMLLTCSTRTPPASRPSAGWTRCSRPTRSRPAFPPAACRC